MEDAGEDTRVGATLARPVLEGTLAYSSEFPDPETVVESAPEPARWGVAAGLLTPGCCCWVWWSTDNQDLLRM